MLCRSVPRLPCWLCRCSSSWNWSSSSLKTKSGSLGQNWRFCPPTLTKIAALTRILSYRALDANRQVPLCWLRFCLLFCTNKTNYVPFKWPSYWLLTWPQMSPWISSMSWCRCLVQQMWSFHQSAVSSKSHSRRIAPCLRCHVGCFSWHRLSMLVRR